MADKRLTRDGLKNSLEGKGNVAKGKIKDAIGGLTGDGRAAPFNNTRLSGIRGISPLANPTTR